jgi:hypothetical protein
MTIQFVVETGTGGTTSTSYATVAQFKQYWENRGVTYSDADATIEAWLNMATAFIDGYNFEGNPLSQNQALEWPRYDVTDKLGYVITGIPTALINAVCYMAAEAKKGPLDQPGEGVKSVTYGPVSKSYSRTQGDKEYKAVEKMLKYFLVTGNQLVRVN